MAATALIKLTQNLITNGPGFVLVGTAVDGPVTVENGDNTGVSSWQIDLVYTAPGSAVPPATPLAFNNNDSTPTASFTPDVPGCYRLVLRIWSTTNRLGPPADVDIRNFVILTPNKGLVIPPYQKDPDPLPTLASGKPGAKPNELNINAFELGWAGDGETDGLMNQLVAEVDLGTGGGGGIPSLDTAKENDVLTANDFVPNLNFPTAVVYDGTHLWILKANFAAVAVFSTSPASWGVAKVDPVTNKYLESVDVGNPGVGGTDNPSIPFDIVTKMIWTGTQLFAYGVNALSFDAFVQEVLRGSGSTPTTFGPRIALSIGPSNYIIGAAWDGTKIWAAGANGTLFRFDPSAPSVPEVSLPVAGNLTDVVYDPDGTPYPDNLPRVYVASGFAVYRIKDVATLTPSVDATESSTSTTRMFLGAGFLYGGESGAISRFIREPLALDFQVGGPTFPLGAIYDPSINKGFFSYIDNSSQNPTVSRISTSLVVEASVVLNPNSFSAVPFAAYDMAVIPTLTSVFVPDEGLTSGGQGDLYKVNTGTLVSQKSTSDFALRYGMRSKVQYVVNPLAPLTLGWDGISDVIAVALIAPAALTIELGLGVSGKRVTITDFFGTADPVDAISFTTLGNPLSGIDNGPITEAFGSVTLVGIGLGGWAVESRSPAGGGGGGSGAPLSNVRFVDLNTSVSVGNDGTPDKPFATITDALLSLAGPAILFITPGDYTGEGTISFNVTTLGAVSLVNMGMGAPISSASPPTMVVLAGVTAFGSGTEPLTVVGIECAAFSANCAVLATDCKLFVFGGGGVGDYVVRSHGFLGQFGGTYHSLRAYGVTIDNSTQGLTDGAGSFDGYGTELYNCRFSNVGDLITNHNNGVRMVGTYLPFGAVNVSFVNPTLFEMDGFTNFYWTQLEDGGLANLSGTVQHLTTRGNVYSTVNLTLGPTADDLTGMGVRNATNLDITPDPGGTTLSGIASLFTFRVDYLYKKMLVNVGPGTLTLQNEGAGSIAANRFRVAGGGDVVLNPDDIAIIDYDLNISRWRVITAVVPGSVPDPLTNTFYVDAGSLAATENGSDEAPFKTLTAAVAAVAAGGIGGTILVVPGDYSGEATISYSASGGQNLSITSLSNGDATYGQDTFLPDLNLTGSSGYVSLTGIECGSISGTISDPAQIIASRCTIGAIGHNSYDIRDTFLDTSLATALGAIQATDSVMISDLTCTSISMSGGAVQGDITCTGTEATLLYLDPGTLKNFTFTPDQGTLIIDPATYSQFVKKGNTLNNGFFDILKPQAFTIETPDITADQNNYTTDDWGNADHVRLNPNGGQFNITGFDSNVRTRRKTLTNVSSTGAIVLVHEDGGSTAANRIALPNPAIETSYLIPESRTVEMYYNTIAGRWQVVQALSEILTVNDIPATGNNNDYVIGGFPGARADVIRLVTTNAGAVITGIAATFGASMDVGRIRKTLINVGPNSVTLKDQDGSSAGANQLKIPGGDLVLGVDESVDIYYDKSDNFWRVI